MKIRDCIKQVQSELQGAELLENIMGKFLHKVFNSVVKELNYSLPNLVELGSEVSHFIPEPRNFSEVSRLTADF